MLADWKRQDGLLLVYNIMGYTIGVIESYLVCSALFAVLFTVLGFLHIGNVKCYVIVMCLRDIVCVVMNIDYDL